MTVSLALTSDKGGVGKSTLAVNLAGALSRRGRVALVDEDRRIRSCLEWAAVQPGALPFTVTDPDGAGDLLRGAAYAVIDTEGRPTLADLVDLTRSVDRVLIPCGPSGLEVRATVALWRDLGEAGADLSRAQVAVTKAPPVGTVGQQARDMLRELGVSACAAVVRSYAAHQRAAELGVLVKDVPDERARAAWSDVLALADEVTM